MGLASLEVRPISILELRGADNVPLSGLMQDGWLNERHMNLAAAICSRRSVWK
jgi:hypothetical protein